MTENTPPSFFSRPGEIGTMIFFALLGVAYAKKFHPLENFLAYEYPWAAFLAVMLVPVVLATIGRVVFRGKWTEVLSLMIASANLGVIVGALMH